MLQTKCAKKKFHIGLSNTDTLSCLLCLFLIVFACRKKLGEGSFGEVWRAQADGILNISGKKLVAVKMLKGMQ